MNPVIPVKEEKRVKRDLEEIQATKAHRDKREIKATGVIADCAVEMVKRVIKQNEE